MASAPQGEAVREHLKVHRTRSQELRQASLGASGMTPLMGDGVTPANIPEGLYAVAGYIDGPLAWPKLAWLRFRGSRLVRIATIASTDDGDALDVENGDATPAQAPAWVEMRRRAGFVPAVYCNQSTWPEVVAAVAAAAVNDPLSWRADWNVPTAHLVAGTIATQYAHDLAPGYDLSQVDPNWVDNLRQNEGVGIASAADLAAFEAAGWTACGLSPAQVLSLPMAGAGAAPAPGPLAVALAGTATPVP